MLKSWRNLTLLPPALLTFQEVTARLLKYLIQVSVTRVDMHLKAESWEARSYNQYVKEFEYAKVQMLCRGIKFNSLSCIQPTNYRIYHLLCVVFPAKPFILFTII